VVLLYTIEDVQDTIYYLIVIDSLPDTHKISSVYINGIEIRDKSGKLLAIEAILNYLK
jgi:hypothetical protein